MSDKPVPERLQVKHGRRLAVIGASAALEAVVGATDERADPNEAEVAVLFVADRAGFDAHFPALLKRLRPDVILWLAYPKLTSPLARDLSRDIIHNLARTIGLDTVSQIAIDQDWSALRLKRL